ncbi:D-inositol 3-phosphate glycosyltransferase [compost metagenome]
MKYVVNKFVTLKVCRLIRKEKIDIVHINTLTTSYVFAKAAIWSKKKYVWHFREFMEEDIKLTFKNSNKAYKLINKADAKIAISKSIYNKYLELFRCDNLFLVYNGICLEDHYRKHRILDDTVISIGIVGRLHENKGQMEFIKAVHNVVSQNTHNIKAYIIGNIEDKEYYIALNNYIITHNLHHTVKILDFTSEMHLLWEKLDITCVCSKAEAFGRVTVEALLAGTLVIGANTGGTPEIISDFDTGLLYEQGNYLSLASKIEIALKDKVLMREIAINGQNRALNNFTDYINAENIIEVYNKIIN